MKEDKRKKIIQTAIQLFIKNGYEKTSMNEIVRLSGVTKGGIYHHFKNKDELFMEVIRHFGTFIESWVAETLSKAETTKDAIHAYFVSSAEIMNAFMTLCPDESLTAIQYYQFMIDSLKRFPKVKDVMGESYQHAYVLLSEKIKKSQAIGEIRNDINAENLSFQMNLLTEGILLLSMVHSEMNLEEIGEQMFHDFWTMLTVY